MAVAVNERSLRDWYTQDAREYLEEHAKARIVSLDDVFKRLDEIKQSADTELPVCFLGNSGVGKSTLINALVAGSESVLPQGGVGPLTAQATLVRYADEPSFRVQYFPRGHVNRLLFALERSLEAEAEADTGEPTPALVEDGGVDGTASADPLEQEDSTSRSKELKKQAALLIRGSQFVELDAKYLADGLRLAMGMAARWGTELEEEDAERVRRVGEVLESVKADPDLTYEVRRGDERERFHEELDAHASGFLAPLIKTLEVRWNSPILEGGLVLVDLPGIGVANDEYRRVTKDWIRKARAIVLVVDRSGMTEASVELLRSTGFLNSMLHESLGDDADPPILSVGVVKVDLVATDKRRKDRQLHGKDARSWVSHFEECCQDLKRVIRGQLQEELGKTVNEGAVETADVRREVVDALLESLEIHPFSAHEYRLLLEDDEDERPHIKDEEQSGIPQFGQALREVVERREKRLQAKLSDLEADAYEKLRGAVRLVLAQWREEERAAEEAERLRADLNKLVEPLQRELDVRTGQFRGFLRETMPTQIESMTKTAAEEARRNIEAYLHTLRGYHWGTLRAAVRRGGAFIGARHVDVPNELTLRFEDPVAVVWSRSILTKLRERTKEMADDYVRCIAKVVEWAKSQGARVKPELVEALHDNLRADTKDVGRIGREAVAEVKKAVKQQLYQYVEETVEERCDAFVASGRDAGTGVKQRMLGLFDELAREVVEAARPAAVRVLTRNYNRVEAEIRKAFEGYSNPLEQAVGAIVSDHETAVRRSDARRRAEVLQTGEDLLTSLEESKPQ